MIEIKLTKKLLEIQDNITEQICRDLRDQGFNSDLFDIFDWSSAMGIEPDIYFSLK